MKLETQRAPMDKILQGHEDLQQRLEHQVAVMELLQKPVSVDKVVIRRIMQCQSPDSWLEDFDPKHKDSAEEKNARIYNEKFEALIARKLNSDLFAKDLASKVLMVAYTGD